MWWCLQGISRFQLRQGGGKIKEGFQLSHRNLPWKLTFSLGHLPDGPSVFLSLSSPGLSPPHNEASDSLERDRCGVSFDILSLVPFRPLLPLPLR